MPFINCVVPFHKFVTVFSVSTSCFQLSVTGFKSVFDLWLSFSVLLHSTHSVVFFTPFLVFVAIFVQSACHLGQAPAGAVCLSVHFDG